MKKIRLSVLAILLWLLCGILSNVDAQELPVPFDTMRLGCGMFPDYIAKLDTPILLPPSFPSGAKDTCGHFIIYYQDKAIMLAGGYAAGFADPTLGLARRNTLCMVLNKIESTFDFSAIPANTFIRLYVDTSLSPYNPADTGEQLGTAAWCGAFFNASTAGDTVNGYAHDLVMNNIDPNPSAYHMQLQVNFDRWVHVTQSFSYGLKIGDIIPISYTTGLDTPKSCEIDLFSVLIHNICHGLGFFSFTGIWHGTPIAPYKSSLDHSIRYSPEPALTPDLLAAVSSTTPIIGKTVAWVNDKGGPSNYPMEDIYHSHFSHDWNAIRISPGNMQHAMMEYDMYDGDIKRDFAKNDIFAFTKILGYRLTAAYAAAHPDLVNNTFAYSSKINSADYVRNFDSVNFIDFVNPDFVITNNVGTTLTISLAADTTLHDPDGDVVSIMPGSLFNVRGCGSGGNNHNLLSISSDGRTITYTPRPNFYGRATFAFDLWDGKERGGFMMYTIDVKKGNNVTLPADGNYVLNGDFEEGSEVKLIDTAEYVNNSAGLYDGDYMGLFANGVYFSDCQPYAADLPFQGISAVIRKSYADCAQSKHLHVNFGSITNSFDWGFSSYIPEGDNQVFDMEAKDGKGNRFKSVGYGRPNLFSLADSLVRCGRYVLELDVKHRHHVLDGIPEILTGHDSLQISFTNNALLSGITHLYDAKQLSKVPLYRPVINDSEWVRLRIPFTYCSDTAADVLWLTFNRENTFIDNITLKPYDWSMALALKDSAITGSCTHHLYVGGDTIANGCGSVPNPYSWYTRSGSLIANSRSIDVTPMDTTDYICSFTDGCTTVYDTLTVIPCKCSPSRVFGHHSDGELGGTIPSVVGSGYYHVSSDITISSSTSLVGTKLLMEPGVRINVEPGNLLTLTNCHLLTCPDTNRLWEGITLESNSGASGRILVNNSTLIEDADTAIAASFPRRFGVQNLIQIDSAIFNRNITGISIDNYKDSTGSDYPFVFRSTVFTSRELSTYSGYPAQWPSAKALRGMYANTAATAPFNLCKNYAERNTKNGVPAFVGLRLTNVGVTRVGTGAYYSLRIGDQSDSVLRNTFDNTGDGIYAVNSNIDVYNTVFLNMHKLTPGFIISLMPLPTGTGIYTKGGGMNIRLQLMKNAIGSNYSVFNRFYDCITGVNAVDCYELNDTGALFQTSNTNPAAAIRGIQFNAARYKRVSIANNSFYNLPNAMALYSATASSGYAVGEVLVDGNTINSQPPSPVSASGSYTCLTAITGGAPLFSAAGSLIGTGYWVFKNNQIYDVYNGIVMANMRKQWLDLEDNDIRLVKQPTGSAQYGIEFSNCLNPQAVRNHVNTLPGSGATQEFARAYYFSGNTGNIVRCNDESNLGRGFDFIGTQPTSQWLGNTMSGNTRGLALGGPIDAQGNNVSSCYAKWNTTGWGPANQQTFAYYPSTYSPLYVSTGPASIPGYISEPTENLGSPPANVYSVITGSLHYSTFAFDPCGQSISVKPPPSSLTATSTAVTHVFGPVLIDFFRFGKREQWNNQMSLFRAISIDSSFNDTLSATLQQFQQGAINTRYAWLAQIEDALAIGDAGTANTLLRSPVTAPGDFMVDSLLVVDGDSANAIVSNYIRFYGICLDRLNGIDPDSSELADLAFRCPLSDGGVVYQARSLYSLCFGYNDIFDEDVLCNISFDN